jgi:hypothetical protein
MRQLMLLVHRSVNVAPPALSLRMASSGRVVPAGTAFVLLMAACSAGQSTIEIRARSSTTAQEGIAGIHIWLNDAPYDASDFRADASGLLGLRAAVPNSGRLHIAMELRQGSDVVAAGSFSIEMTQNFEWGMDLFRQIADPLAACFGCFGAERFPVIPSAQNEPGEAVWFAWGGERRGSDVVY